MRHSRPSRARRWYWLLAPLLGAIGAVSCADEGRAPRDDAPQAGEEAGSETAGTKTRNDSGGAAGSTGAAGGGRQNAAGEPNAGGVDAVGGASSSGGVETNAGGMPTDSGGAGTSAGMGGQADAGAGQAGAAGEPQLPPAGEACIACGADKCSKVVNGCEKNPECGPWLACVKACDSEACSSACDASYSAVARVYHAVYACLCSACEGACGVAGACQKQCGDDDGPPPSATEPNTLAETGLYSATQNANGAALIAPYVYLYEPQYALWADGAGKERYIYVPRCATIDSSDMDHWQFPVGTRLWKHFSVDGKLVETRMLHRFGSGPGDWLFATYGWDASKPNDPKSAVAVLHGLPNANGTLHDIPDPSACTACHGKLPDKPLGFGAVQLSHGGVGLTMQKLSDWGWLSLPARSGFKVPGTPVQQAALGYLHANCGGCHNSYGEIPRENPMKLRLLVAQTNYAETDTVLTTVGVPTVNPNADLHGKPRISPQSRAGSAIFLRMSNRDNYPMPPLATKFPDSDGGVADIGAWIDSLPKE